MGREEPKSERKWQWLGGQPKAHTGRGRTAPGRALSPHASPALPRWWLFPHPEVKGTHCVQSKHVAFSPSCSWLGVSQSTCVRCSQIAMESRSSSTPEVISPSPRGLAAAACSAVALPDIMGGWEEVAWHQVPLCPASHCQPLLSTPLVVIEGPSLSGTGSCSPCNNGSSPHGLRWP